jgi:hypothetical protein
MSEQFSDSSERQYVCFVCGITFKTYLEYQEHILKEHEEGRDYIKCPLARCQAPVRDVIAHFKSKHPNEPLPKKGMLKALVWADKRGPRKKKPKFKDGFLLSTKNGGKQMHYRSSWEREIYEYLEKEEAVAGYMVESLKVEYFYKGKMRNYIPDLLIHFKDGHYEVWEVKPSNQHSLKMNEAKWAACRNYCLARGWQFEVINETTMKLLKMKLLNEGK